MRLFLNRLIKFSENYTNKKYAVGSNDWLSVAYGNGIYIAVGENNIIGRSTDGINWTTETLSTSDRLECVVYGYDRFLLFGKVNTSSGQKTRFRYSTSGTIWNIVPTLAEIPGVNSAFYGCKMSNSTVFMTVSNVGMICYSSNGISWGLPFHIGNSRACWHDIIYTGSYNVVVGNVGQVYISSDDGENTWVDKSPNGYSEYTFESVAYGNNKLVVVGWKYNDNTDEYEGVVLNTSDYENWTETNIKCPIVPKSIIYHNNKFVICGYKKDSNGNDVGCIVTSDGLNFSNIIRSDNEVWNKVIYSNDEFLAIGNNGSMCNLTF